MARLDAPLPPQGQGCTVDHPAASQPSGFEHAPIESLGNLSWAQIADCHRYRDLAEVAVGVDVARRLTADAGRIDIDGIGNQGGRRVRRCGRRRQDCGGIGNPKRKRTPAPARSRDAAHRPVMAQRGEARKLR